jgi:16S rRNA (guanine(527)-N(7))-methyltransferase RsmG
MRSGPKRISGDYKAKAQRHHEKLPPGLPSLKRWFQRSNLTLNENQYKQLWKFHTLLREKNEAYDLTRIYQFDNMVQKHYIDCILVAKLLNWDLPSPLLDIGTGAGFPGIPLKIACPDVDIILSEGRHKRVQFLREVVEALGLKGITVYDHKVYASFGMSIQGAITRALESMPKTLARVRTSLLPGGKVIFMKGPGSDQEVLEALLRWGSDYQLDRDISYSIPRSPYRRRLIVFSRRPSSQNGLNRKKE